MGLLDRSWGCESGADGDCENHFWGRKSGHGCWNDPGSEIDDESEISHAVETVSVAFPNYKVDQLPWPCLNDRRPGYFVRKRGRREPLQAGGKLCRAQREKRGSYELQALDR